MTKRFQPQRTSLSDDEYGRLDRVKTQFAQALAFHSAMALRQFPSDLHDLVLSHLQDSTSLYAPFTADTRDGIVVALNR